MRASEFLTELFEPKTAFEITWDDYFGPKEIHATAYDRQGREIDISFVPINNDTVEVEFMRGGSHDITGAGDAPQVLGTVLEAIKTYLTKYYRAPYVVFSSSKNEESRSSVYQALINRFAKQLGYTPVTSDKIPASTFMLKHQSAGQE